MPRRKTNGKPRRQPCHAISSFHRIEGNAHTKVEEQRDLNERIADLPNSVLRTLVQHSESPDEHFADDEERPW